MSVVRQNSHKLHPPKWFKMISRPLMSRLTQCATGHAYTGEYYKRFIPSLSTSCPCSEVDLLQTREHVLFYCPLISDNACEVLRALLPDSSGPSSSISLLFKTKNIAHLARFLQQSQALSKSQAPTSREPPEPP